MNKGISPLIAGVLLIAFTLAVAAIISGWLTSVTRTTTSKVETGLSEQVECSRALIEIINVSENVTNTQVAVVIQNKGSIDLKSGFSIVCGSVTGRAEGPLAAGEVKSFTFDNVYFANCTNREVTISSLDCPEVSDTCRQGTEC